MRIGRREFLVMGAAASAGRIVGSEPPARVRQALGLDNYAVRAMGWKAGELIDYAAKLKVDTLFITDLDAFRSLEEEELLVLRGKAEAKQIQILLGTWSICPSSVTFKDSWGTADEHLQLGIRVASSLGSPVLRVVLGSSKDRLGDGGIDARIADMVTVLQRNKARAVDANVKIAVENHAGDMHSLELKSLVEAAGSDFVGVNLDSGNALRCLETPMQNLENLGEYVLTTSLRDSAVWESENGVVVQWTAMGEGMVDWKAYFARFAELCPGVAANIETISGFNHEIIPESPGFAKAWPKGPPTTYEDFSKWAETGKPRKPWKVPGDQQTVKAQQEYQLGELERSIAYCKSLGLGLRD